jgi:hypothetical protein
MSARGGPFATALAVAGSWLLEPAEPGGPARHPAVSAPASARLVVAVFGLGRRCGATVVARALAAELASRDAHGAAAVHCEARAAGIPLATPAASRLARRLADLPGAEARAIGRLCLIGGAEQAALADTARQLAPLVLDAGATALGGVPAAVADEVVLVGGPSTEPALATVAADCLGRLGHQPAIVLNRARDAPAGPAPDPAADPAAADPAHAPWAACGAHVLPDSRMGAQLALGGREPRGALGKAVADLADRLLLANG